MKAQYLATHYLATAGVLMVMGRDFLILIRASDGSSQKFSYEELGFSEKK